MTVHRLSPTIGVYVRGIGHCKALFLLDYHEQNNSMWKVRVHETGKVLNAYDDDIIILANLADGEKDSIPEEWQPKPSL